MTAEHPPSGGSQSRAATGSGSGSVGDALGPFADALVAAAATAGAQPAGDPRVGAAFQVGWLMDDILAGRAYAQFPPGLDLPPATGFEAQARHLASLIATLKLTDVDPAAVVAELAGGVAAPGAATAWQPQLAAALSGDDLRLAKAYGLGRELAALAHGVLDRDTFTQPSVASMLAALDDLSTVLPPHAARGVANSIRRWMALTATPDHAGILLSQCTLWRTVLTGEKKGTEFLEPENYVDAAERLAAKLRATSTVLLKRIPVLVGLIVVLFLAGVAVLIFAPAQAGTTAAGLSGVLAALGLTWKVVGGAAGKLVATLEAPLWGAELDGAITDAITLVAQPAPSVSIRQRRKRATSGDYAGRAARPTRR